MSQHGMAIGSASIGSGISERNVLYLTRVSYNEPKHEMLVEFAGPQGRLVERHRFFPFTLFSSAVEKDKLEGLLLSAGFKGFSLEEENGLLCLRALSVSELNKISNSLAIFLNKKPLVLPAGRSFLLQKGWSYFDSFEKVGSVLYKFNPVQSTGAGGSFGGPDLGFFLTKEIPFSEALKLNEPDALFLVNLAAWSNILSVPIESVPKSMGEKTEFFIENIFFRHGEPLSFNSNGRVFSSKGFEPLGFGDSLSKMDFSLVWAELFSSNFFNIGPETRNCACCAPVVLESKNLLPSSLIKVRFLEDDFFFESSSESFALDFHNNNPLKEKRLEKKKEFFLSTYPIGPFYKNSAALVPLMDARRIISDGRACLVSGNESALAPNSCEPATMPESIGGAHELNWFCLNKESFFSREVRSANALLFSLRSAIGSHKDASLFPSRGFSGLYFRALFDALSLSLAELPLQLTNPNSKFFSTELAKSIVSVQEATIARFKEFSEKEGYRVLHANRNSAFVKGFSSLKLAKDFSAHTRLPQPQIAGFSRKALGGFA